MFCPRSLIDWEVETLERWYKLSPSVSLATIPVNTSRPYTPSELREICRRVFEESNGNIIIQPENLRNDKPRGTDEYL